MHVGVCECVCVCTDVSMSLGSLWSCCCAGTKLQREEENKGDCDDKFYLHCRTTVYSPRETHYEKPLRDLMERKAIARAQLPAHFREAM